ncbi:response regulator transcription factor [Variovorax sp. LjRoot290]|uniref:response regulator transcription factor n=1 Tax=Variovorax sp. LjRoot290 TaxID=3342316 RepID=UPI003ED1318C
MTVYVVDDHPMMRDAIVMAVRRLRPDSNIVELDCIGAVYQAVNDHGPPALVSMDINLPDNDSDAGVAKVRTLFPNAQIAVFSTLSSSEMEEVCVASGADIYVEKASGRGEYAAALQGLLQAGNEHDEAPDADSPSGVFKLSKRQKQLIAMIDRGLTNSEMATALGLVETTVKVHLWRLYRKLGVNNRSRALHIARGQGLLA